MANPIVRGFTQLGTFRGRDTRAQFWSYAGVVIVLHFLLSSTISGAMMSPVFEASAPPSEAALLDHFNRFLIFTLLSLIILAGLLAAATARRLHDTGRSALWALLPVPFATYSGVMFFRLFTQFLTAEPDMGVFLSVFVSNLLYLAGLLILIILLVRNSAPGPNRYG